MNDLLNLYCGKEEI